MRRSIAALAVSGALMATGLATAAPAAGVTGTSSTAGFTANGCTATMSDIGRVTVNGKAVLRFTGKVTCGSAATQILLHTTLFSCDGLRPKATKHWLLADCGYLTSAETFTPVRPGVTYPIASGDVPAADGYYAPVMNFNVDGAASGPDFGTPVLCANGTCTNTTYLS